MFPASFAAWVPVFIATATSACASAGASFVPSPVIATSRPSACCARISASLASGVASARKSSTPASAAIVAAVSRLSPVIITVLIPIRRSSANRSLMPPFTMSFNSITPSTRAPAAAASATTSGVAPRRATVSTSVRTSGGKTMPFVPIQAAIASAAPLRIDRPGRSTPLIRVCAENGTKVALERLHVPLAQAERRLRQHDDAPAFRRLVGERRELRGIAEVARRDPRRGMERRRLAVAERDGAGLVEQQDVDVARRLDRAARHRDDVLPDQTADAGDADRGEERADRGGDEANEQRDEHGHRHRLARFGRVDAVDREREQRHRDVQKDDRQGGEEDTERDLVRRLLAARRLDHARSSGRGTSRPDSP